MGVNKIVLNTENGEESLIDLTEDTVNEDTLLDGATAHTRSGDRIEGKVKPVLYESQTLTPDQQSQARANIGAGRPIIDVVELPTEDIDKGAFYRLLTGSFVYNQFVQNACTCISVASLPEVGEPVTMDMQSVVAYYNAQDENVYGYINSTLSAAAGVPAGWYTLDMLAPAFDLQYKGIITDILDDPLDNSYRLLLGYSLYRYDNEWVLQETIGQRGFGPAAEIFNHPSNSASGDASHAEGRDTTASGDYSHAEGFGTTASGYNSHAEGRYTTVSGDYSHAEGFDTTASGDYSHAEGFGTTASGASSHAEGRDTTASGDSSHAEGYGAHAEGYGAHAEGFGTTASGDYQHVQGKYNVEDPDSKYLHIVGNAKAFPHRSNAHTLDWDGNAWYAGDVYVGSNSGTHMDEGAVRLARVDEIPDIDGLATEEFVNQKIADIPVPEVDVAQEIGTSTTAVMSQKAVTDALLNLEQAQLEFVSSIEEMTDISKYYVMGGYIYAWMLGETGPTYTNILEGATLYVNKRYSKSSAAYKDADGYVSTDWIAADKGDIIRFNVPLSAHQASNSRIYCKAGTTIGWADGQADYYMPVTEENDGAVTSIKFCTIYTNPSNHSAGTTVATSAITHFMLNVQMSTSSVTEEQARELIITINEEITAGGGSGYSWQNTGHAFAPADYESRIISLETKEKVQDEAIVGLLNDIQNVKSTGIALGEIFAPSPQSPADSTENADFNADSMTAQEIYDVLDALCDNYPNYITKEVLGKETSGKYDVNRYVLCKHFYSAWQRQNYPKMYGWANGSVAVYSASVSPRIGDMMYSAGDLETEFDAVEAVNNANQTRTVGGVVYTRDETLDVEPTLVYTSILADTAGSTVYNSSKGTVTTISSISGATLTGANGTVYERYPMGDRDSNMAKLHVVTIGANEHGPTGDPREPAIVCTRLIQDICECKESPNVLLNHLKNNVMLVMVPVINPFGFNKGSNGSSLDGYYNSNNVNINRNYDTPGWGNDSAAGGQGAYGGSEIETQYFMDTIVGSNVAVSVHCLAGSNSANHGLCHVQGNGFESGKVQKIAETMKANYNLSLTSYGTADPASYAKSPSFITQAGAKGGIIEMNDYDVASGAYHSARTLEADYTLLLECIYMWLTDYLGT